VVEGASQAPPGVAALPYTLLEPRTPTARSLPVPRRLVGAVIGGASFPLHVDLGAVPSQLRDELWERAGLVPREVQTTAVDEVGTGREVRMGSEPATVTVGSLTGTAAFIPYADRRWAEQDIAGTLGLGFFARYTVWASWQRRSLQLVARRPLDAATRIARWDSPVLAKCKNPGQLTLNGTPVATQGSVSKAIVASPAI